MRIVSRYSIDGLSPWLLLVGTGHRWNQCCPVLHFDRPAAVPARVSTACCAPIRLAIVDERVHARSASLVESRPDRFEAYEAH